MQRHSQDCSLCGSFKWIIILLAGAAALSACSGPLSAQTEGSGSRQISMLGQFDTENLAVPRDQILRGGPPKDGIPALTDPSTTPASQAAFLDDDDRIVAVDIEGEARAYPLRLLNWHEIVNDVVGGVPIAVVYCPLCDSASVVDRRIGGETLEFGVSGLLHNSNVILYDRTHDALWSQVGMRAISGPLEGRALKHLPFDLVPFGEWHQRAKGGTVANFETGHRRDYRRNPYASYFQNDRLMFPVSPRNRDLPVKSRVLGIESNGVKRAYPLTAVTSAPGARIEDTLGEEKVVLEAASDETIRVIEMPEDARFVHTFWFAWAAFHPDTTVYGVST